MDGLCISRTQRPSVSLFIGSDLPLDCGELGTQQLGLIAAQVTSLLVQRDAARFECFAPGGTITGVTAGTGLTGGGTSVVTGVAADADLTGGGMGGVVTLNLDTTKVPQLNAANIFTGNRTVNGNLSATGVVTGSSYQIGSSLFAFGSYANYNAFLGFAGNSTMTGAADTATGNAALPSNTTGSWNVAVGVLALTSNTTGTQKFWPTGQQRSTTAPRGARIPPAA